MFSSSPIRKAHREPFVFPWYALSTLAVAVAIGTLSLYAGFVFHALGL